jgi:hypothetical protein
MGRPLLSFLSLLLVIDPMQLQDVSFSPFCVQIQTAYKIQKCWGQNLSFMQGNLCTILWSLDMQHFIN